MSADPVLHVTAGPNGSGKSTFVDRVLQPATHLPVINADVIAADRWPQAAAERAYEAARVAASRRVEMMASGQSFITETVFSHASKVDLITSAVAAGYHVNLHVMLVPADTTVGRVADRVRRGGHTVPETKVRERYERVWPLVIQARELSEHTRFYDNSSARRPFLLVARYERGHLIGSATWPAWAPPSLSES